MKFSIILTADGDVFRTEHSEDEYDALYRLFRKEYFDYLDVEDMDDREAEDIIREQKEEVFESKNKEFYNSLPDILKQLEVTEENCEDYCDDLCCFHRKFVGIVDKKTFYDIVDTCGMYCEKTETMGSLGAPGFGCGIVPAICFENEIAYIGQRRYNMYATPMPDVERKNGWTERDFYRIKEVLLREFGY